jgi:hypothetical protein
VQVENAVVPSGAGAAGGGARSVDHADHAARRLDLRSTIAVAAAGAHPGGQIYAAAPELAPDEIRPAL